MLRNIERIIREEMDAAGAKELLMPALQPAELWMESGRYLTYGPELFRLADRHQRGFALGPTHGEVVTMLVKNEIPSCRRLPVSWPDSCTSGPPTAIERRLIHPMRDESALSWKQGGMETLDNNCL